MTLARSLVATVVFGAALSARAQAGAPAQPWPPPSVPNRDARILTLDEALATARRQQPQLRQAQANVAAATARSDQALAPLLPQVNATGAYTRSTANYVYRPGSSPVGTTRTV